MNANVMRSPDIQVTPVGTAAAAPAVVALQTSDVARWNRFVLDHPEGTFFHRAEWVQVLKRAFGHRSHYLYAERGGQICGVLPLAEVKSALFGHSLVSLPSPSSLISVPEYFPMST